MSFINFNNRSDSQGARYTKAVVKEALLKIETKNEKKVDSLLEGLAGKITLNEALELFSQKLLAMSALDTARLKTLREVNESAEETLADDVNGELFTAWFDGTVSVTATTTNKTWDDGVPVLKELARGRSKTINLKIKGEFSVVHDVAQGWFYFTDGNTWYGLHQDDGYTDIIDLPFNTQYSESEAVDVNEARSIKKIQTEFDGVVADMAATVASWKSAEGDSKTQLLDKLKSLTQKRNDLTKELDLAIMGKDRNVELVGALESVVTEAMFKAKDHDKTLVSYAIDPKADEIYVISVAKVVDSGFPDVYKVPDKRFHVMFGMMLEDTWLTQYDKLPEAGDILPAPKKDKAFESKVTEGVMSEIDIIAKEAKNFKEFIKAFKTDNRYKGLDTAGEDKEFEAWLKSIYDAAKEDLDESVKIDELRLTSYGVKDLLKAVQNRLDLLPQLGFDKFKDVIHHLKYGDQEEQNELRDKLKELGVNVAYESVVTESKTISFTKASMMGSKLLNKIRIGTIIDTKGGQYEITGFGQQANAFKEFEATIDGKEVKVKLTAMYGLKLEVTDDVRSARFNKEEEINSIILESVVTEAVKEVVLSNEILDFLEERGILKASDAQKVHKDLTAFLKEKGINESKEADEAESILNDLLDERDMDELHGMSMEDALDTVEAYGHSGSKAKKIAQELVSMTNESLVNEGKDSALQDYVETVSQKTFKGGGNGQNLLDDAMGLAGHIDSYTLGRDTRGYEEDGFYEPATIALFKKLVDSMSADDIKNNQAEKFESLDLNEGAVKQFETDMADMIKNIKSGYGWIDPEYVADTWENSSDSIDFELVKGEIYKRLIAAKLLAYASDEDEEEAGTYVKSLKELGIKESVVTEANPHAKPAGLSKEETMEVAQRFADAMSKADGKKVTVNKRTLEEDSFDLDVDGEEFDGGSYNIFQNGNVMNMAVRNNPVYGKKNDSVDTIAKNMKKMSESVVTEEVLCEATVEMDAMDPDDKDFLKFLKKHKVEIIDKRMDGPGGGQPVITMQGKRKDLETVLADEELGWADPDLAEYIEESAVTKAPLSWEALIERVNRPINENLRSKVKTYIKRNEDELNALADSDNWDVIYDKMRSEFDIEEGSEEDKDLIDTFKFTF